MGNAKTRPRRRSLLMLAATLVGVIPSMAQPIHAHATSTYESVVLADSPSAYFRLGEPSGSTAADDSGNGNNASYEAHVTYGVTAALAGDSDTAIHGDGTHTPVTGSDSWTPTGASSWTVEGWIQSSSSSAKLIASWGDPCCNAKSIYFYQYDATHLEVSWGSGTKRFAPYFNLADGGWHYLAFTFDGTTITSYVDGSNAPVSSSAGTAPTALNLTQTGTSWAIGGHSLESTAPLDEVAVYPTNLAASRIHAHFSAANIAAGSCPSVPTTGYGSVVHADSPLAYYRLGEASGPAAEDYSGNCRNATYNTGVTLSEGGALVGDTDTAIHGDGSHRPVKGDDSWTPTGASSWTIDGWIKSSSSSPKLVASWGDPCCNSKGLYFYMYDASHLEVSWSAGTRRYSSAANLSDGYWHYLAATFDGTTITTYVDGVAGSQTSSAGSAPNTMDLSKTGNSFAIGGVSLESTAPLDEVAVYGSALPAPRIRAHFMASGHQRPLTGGALTSAEAPGGPNPCIVCWIAGAITGEGADPVNTASGNFFESFADMSIAGRSYPLALVRTYNSQNAATNSPFGYGWTFNYATSLACSSTTATITQGDGSQTTFTTAGNCSSGSWTPSAPRTIATLVHNGGGTWTFTRQGRDTLTFNSSGQLTTMTDLNGYATSLTYTTSKLTSVTDPAGRTLTLGWTGNNITSLTDANVSPNRAVGYAYDVNGDLTDVTDVNGGVEHLTYSSHRVTVMKDPVCQALGGGCPGVQNHYDGNGRVDWQKDQLNRETDFAYAGSPGTDVGGTTTITDPEGNVVVDGYQYGVRTFETRGSGTADAATTYLQYDPDTLALTAIIDPNGGMTTMTVDGSGNVLTQTDPLGRVVTMTYNAFNEPLTVTDGKGVTTTNAWDGNGNLTSVSTPASGGSCTCAVTTYNRADNTYPGDVTSIDDPNGKTTYFHRDGNGYVDQVKNPLGKVSGVEYNAIGWVKNTWTPKAGCTWNSSTPTGCSSTYKTANGYGADKFGDVQTITDPLSHVVTLAYNANRQKISVQDANGNTTTFTIDVAGQLTTTTRPDATTQVTDYNDDGTVLDQKDGAGTAIQTYGRNHRGEVITVTDALTNVTTYTRDANGNVLTKMDPSGSCPSTNCASMTYNADNELATVSYSDGVTPNITSITRDNDGQRTGMTDGTGTSAWTWDNLHRLTGYTNGNGDTVTLGYASDLKNQIATIAYPNSVGTVTQTWNDDGTLASVQDWNGKTTSFGHDDNANETSQTSPSTTNVTDTFGFNAADELTSVSDSNGSTLFAATYTRDSNGQLASDSSQAANQANYKYTSLNQLCYAGSGTANACSSAPANSYPYAFNSADNLTKIEDAGHGGFNTQSFNAADQLCWTVSGASGNACNSAPGGAATYGFDDRGNRTYTLSGSGTCNGYDQANHLTSVKTGTGSTCTTPATLGTYAYDGSGLRQSKTVSGTTTRFTWLDGVGLPLLLQEKAGAGNPVSYIYGPGGIVVEQIAGATTTYLHHDQLGSIRLITDSAGNTGTATTRTWDPFGNGVATSGALTSNLGFSGEYRDAETGLIYLRARYYDPTTGQFLTVDPAVSATRSPYAYTAGNPLNSTDPSGLAPCAGRWVPGNSCPPRPTPTPSAPAATPCPAPVPTLSDHPSPYADYGPRLGPTGEFIAGPYSHVEDVALGVTAVGVGGAVAHAALTAKDVSVVVRIAGAGYGGIIALAGVYIIYQVTHEGPRSMEWDPAHANGLA